MDRAIAAAVLDAIPPAGSTATLEALEQVVTEHDTTRQALPLALEKARYEAQRAGRHYDLVDPEHRLVAGELEPRWKAALARVTAGEARLATLQSQQSTLSEEQRQSLRTLGGESWHLSASRGFRSVCSSGWREMRSGPEG